MTTWTAIYLAAWAAGFALGFKYWAIRSAFYAST